MVPPLWSCCSCRTLNCPPLPSHLSLHPAPGVAAPRLHHLRHSFAVGRLLRWYREGIDVNSRLLQLATFLGHVHPVSTAHYLTVTENLFVEASCRFQDFARSGGVS